MIQVLNAIYGGSRFQGGADSVVDLDPDGSKGLTGFCLDKDGKLRASNVEIRGHIEADSGTFKGILDAKRFRILGGVTVGTTYLLKSDNTFRYIMAINTSWVTPTAIAILKEIRTTATGSCIIRILFPTVGSNTISNINIGSFKLVVNDIIVQNWTNISKFLDIALDFSSNITRDINTIQLYAQPGASTLFVPGIFNTIFELRCNEDPGLMGML